MQHNRSPRGPWIHQLFIYSFSLLFALLLYWLLGFVLRDIGSWPGPDYANLERAMVSPQVLREGEQLSAEIDEASRTIADYQQRQALLRDSTANSEKTMNQLLELNRRALDQNLQSAADDRQVLTESRLLFLTNQTRYQEINERIGVVSEQLRDLEARRRTNQLLWAAQRQPVQVEFNRLMGRHQLKLAALKLAFLLPLLALAVWLFVRKRGSLYAPLIYGLGGATLVKVGWVIHDHFPRRYFKYVLILAALLVVVRVLVYLLRMTAHPKKEWLLKQYREAYQHFLCPICRYPIRRGPLKYLFWNRRSLRKVTAGAVAAGNAEPEEPYTCPVCGTPLFEECPACRTIRHSLLPVCTRCGIEKTPSVGA